MKVEAKLHLARIAPRKIRLLTKLIVGMHVHAALQELSLLSKRAAEPLQKLIKSAVANAEHNFQLKKDDLVITKAFVNQGPVFKRFMPRAMGRAALIRKRTSNVTVILEDKKKEAIEKKPKKEIAKK